MKSINYDSQIKRLKAGRHRADRSLYLEVRPSGSAYWTQRPTVNGRQRDAAACRLRTMNPDHVLAHESGHAFGFHHTSPACPHALMRPFPSGDACDSFDLPAMLGTERDRNNA